MRVLMTTDTVGGVWNYSLDLARGLAPLGVEVQLATMGGPLSPLQRAEAQQISGLVLRESSFKLEWMRDPWSDVQRAGSWLKGLGRLLKPDLVHLNNYAHGALGWDAPVLVVGHSCVLSWWDAVHGRPAPNQWAPYRRAVRDGLHAADFVVAPSRAMLDALKSHYGALPRSAVIHNGRHSDRFAPSAKEPFVFSAGRLWDEAKNIAVAARAAPRFRWPLCIAGESRHPDGGALAVDSVELLGVLGTSEIAARLARASIFLHPASYEPFGLTVVEAALSGCALVLGDVPALRELWGGAALFVPPRDEQAIADAVNYLIDEPLRRELLAQRARARARDFSIERTIAGYHTLYGAMLHRNSPCIADHTEVQRETRWTNPSRS